jgi:RNA polymerase sigma-70 factor (sigma-E family)
MWGEEVHMPRSVRDEEFSAFVSAHRAGLLRSAYLLTAGDTHRAEDLVQTALARLYVAWPRVRRSGTQASYARRIIVNAHIDEVRNSRWHREMYVPEPPDRPGPAPPGSCIDAEAIRAALAALPPHMRAVVVLRHWLDLSVEETANLLNCSTGAVKSQTAKATARLRSLLTDAGATTTSKRSHP